MYCPISCDLKLAAIQLFELEHLSLNDILLCCNFSWCMFFCILKLWCMVGNVVIDLPQ